MAEQTVIVVGAGASGLLAAHLLSIRGFKVTILEARDRIGGRIHTITNSWGRPVELGAEFIHGDVALSMELVKEVGIRYHPITGQTWQAKGTEPQHHGHIIDHWKEFEDELRKLDTDRTIDQFLNEKFGAAQYASLRDSVRRYASGYDTADTAFASTKAFAQEWLHEEHAHQYRIDNGYQAMLDYLVNSCVKQDGVIHTSHVVKQITWGKNTVTITTANGAEFRAGKAIITVPVSVLRASPSAPAFVNFSPAIPQIGEAAGKIAIGAVIKILLRFKDTLWHASEIREVMGKDLRDVSFIFSGERVPTWWTQSPDNVPLLTGWIGGPPAEALKECSDEEIKTMALRSLANILEISLGRLETALENWHIANWTADPYTMGSYSYATVGCEPSRYILNTPIADTLYFAGEALYDGPAMGTVEAAFTSGKEVAERILRASGSDH